MNHAIQTAITFLAGCVVAASSAYAGEVSKTPVRLTQGGTAEKPAVFDGKGMVIDLGVDVTDHAWEKEGDVWSSTAPLSGSIPVAPGQHTAMFLDEMPIPLARDTAAERASGDRKVYRYLPPADLKPGQMGFTQDGLMYFRWPASKSPDTARIIVMPRPALSGVTIACSYITVRNITVMHASNDGFNIHNDWVGVRLENVRALSNADEGISAHENVQMDVDGAEIAWNGSSDGGVADVGQSTTTYKNCQVHDNIAAAFKFAGKSHSVADTVIYNQPKDFTIGKDTVFKEERVERRQK